MLTPEDEKTWKNFIKRMANTIPSISYVPFIYDNRKQASLDLHGMTLQMAHNATMDFIKTACCNKQKHITIITGISGQIRSEFECWIAFCPQVKNYHIVNGDGAFKIYLKS